MTSRVQLRLGLAISLVVLAALAAAASASAAPAPHWQILGQAGPTYFHPGDSLDFYEVVVVNDGSAGSEGTFTLADEVPAGLRPREVVATAALYPKGVSPEEIPCTTAADVITCSGEGSVPVSGRVILKINVEVPTGTVGPLEDEATINGGGVAEGASTTITTPVVSPSTPIPYGARVTVEATDVDGNVATQAGSHPYSLSTIFAANIGNVRANEDCSPPGTDTGVSTSPGCGGLVAASRDIEVALPPGVIGNPQNIPQCPQERFQAAVVNAGCPADTQVGAGFLSFYGEGTAEQFEPIYNIQPPPGQPAEFGFIVGGLAHIVMHFHVRADGDYGITAKFPELTAVDAVRLAELTFWGVPAARSHDESRYSVPTCESHQRANGEVISGCGVGAPATALLSMPTSCAQTALPTPLRVDSWAQPGLFSGGDPDYSIEPMGGCNRVPFDPTLEVSPTTTVADSPTGLHVDLHVPQPEVRTGVIGQAEAPGESEGEREIREGREEEEVAQVAAGLVRANLRDAAVALPRGITVNPSSANGLTGCLPEQIDLHRDAPAACPDSAKLGSVEIDTPLLAQPLFGAVYLAQPYQNPFDSLLAIYIAVYDPISGVVVKLAGRVDLGPEGQLTATFSENPQLPFENFKLDFFNGPRAPLRTPALCGSYGTTSTLTPWSAPESGPPATLGSSFPITGAPTQGSCPTTPGQQPNQPTFNAGTESVRAGAYSPFVLHLKREDDSQQFSALNVDLPEGLLGKLAGIPYCPDAALAAAAGRSGAAEAASASCPAASEVGTVDVGAGAGVSPYYVRGKAYLAGPYKGAPLSLAIVTPAVAGPYDLGTVVVRSALEVDPTTAKISVKSDPIPTELKGIPLDVRSIDVRIGRPDFTLNPTSCDGLAIGGSEISTVGQGAKLENSFQVGGCGDLKFKPKLNLDLKGSTGRAGHPGLKAVLTYPQGSTYANIAAAQVNLPHSEFIDQGNLNKTCTRPVLLAGGCPASSVYGSAKAWTPLLDQPLEGPVYLVGGFGYKLPALVAELKGQIRILLVGKVDTGPNKGIRTTFESVPDAPVSRFVLQLKGGPKYSLLENSENLCRQPQRAIARFTAQNALVDQLRPKMSVKCAKRAGSQKKSKKGRSR